MEEVKISSKGQLVIPKYLRDALGLAPGKRVLVMKSEGKLVIIPKPDDPVNELVKVGKDISITSIRRDIKGE